MKLPKSDLTKLIFKMLDPINIPRAFYQFSTNMIFRLTGDKDGKENRQAIFKWLISMRRRTFVYSAEISIISSLKSNDSDVPIWIWS